MPFALPFSHSPSCTPVSLCQNVKALLRRGTARELLGFYPEAYDGMHGRGPKFVLFFLFLHVDGLFFFVFFFCVPAQLHPFWLRLSISFVLEFIKM